jgi:polyhydroxybutyrate depolymerase
LVPNVNPLRLLVSGFLLTSAGGCQQPSRQPPAASARPAAEVVSVQAAPVPSSSQTAPMAKSAAAVPPAPLQAPMHLPPQLAAGQKAPLLLMLHSIGTSAEDIERRTDWPKFAERNGLAWLAPNGPVDSLGRRFWDAGPSCCNFSGQRIDHVAALRELLERTLEEYPIDRDRVFVGGISNGGFMAHRLACEAPELLHGVVSISGAGPLENVACKTPSSLRVLEIHGDADRIVSYAGGHFLGMAMLPEHASAQKTVGDWAARLACSGEPTQAEPIDLEKRFAGKETRVTRYRDCQRGALELWTVSGGDHYLAFYEPSPQLIWQFLNQ